MVTSWLPFILSFLDMMVKARGWASPMELRWCRVDDGLSISFASSAISSHRLAVDPLVELGFAPRHNERVAVHD